MSGLVVAVLPSCSSPKMSAAKFSQGLHQPSCRSFASTGRRFQPLPSRKRPSRVHRHSELVACQASPIEVLEGAKVVHVSDGLLQDVLGLWDRETSQQRCVLAFLTHWADLGSWEYAQKLSKRMQELTDVGVAVSAIGLGSVSGAREFSKFTGFPEENLFADPDGACCSALGYARGFAPDANISPYAKLFPMLLGIDSEGTINEVLKGYVGSRDKKEVFEGSTPFNLLGKGYQRPFELATLRLMNSTKILSNWEALCPPKTELITQQGGTIVFEGEDILYQHKDTGILVTPDVDKVVSVATSFSELADE